MDGLYDWWDKLPVDPEIITLSITLFSGLLTQYFSVWRELKGSNGMVEKELTVVGKSLIVITLLLLSLSIKLHFERKSKEESEKLDNKTYQTIIKERLRKAISERTELATQITSTSQTCAETQNTLADFGDTVLSQLKTLNTNFGTLAESCKAGVKLETDDRLNQKIAAQRNALVASKAKVIVPLKYQYTLTLSSLDISGCSAQQSDTKYYWDLDVGIEELSSLTPKYAREAKNDLVAIALKKPYEEISFSPNAEFSFSGYIRELTGRSLIRRFYQYRYKGFFNQSKTYQPNVDATMPIELKIDARGKESGKPCEFVVTGKLARKTIR